MSGHSEWLAARKAYLKSVYSIDQMGMRRAMRLERDYMPVIADPSGCAHCGRNESGHYWSTSCESRVYTEPTQLQRKERMIARRLMKELVRDV